MKHYSVFILLLLQLFFAASCNVEPDIVTEPLDFTITVSDIQENAALVNVVPSHEDATYYFSVIGRSEFSNDAEFISSIIAADPDIADRLVFGEASSKFQDLKDGQKYVAFAFELKKDLTFGQIVDFEEFSTPKEKPAEEVKPDYENVDFEIRMSDNDDKTMDMNVIVNDDHVPYYFDIVSKETFEMYDYFSPEGIQAFVTAMFKSYGKKFGLSADQVYEELVVKGNGSRKYTKLLPGSEYYAFAVGMAKKDVVMTEPELSVFRTADPEPSDLQIEFEVLKQGPYSGKVKFLPSDPERKYFFEFWEAENVDFYGLDDQGVIDRYEENYGEYISMLAVSGEQIYYREDLLPYKEYIVIAFGVDGNVANTGLFKTFFTTEGPVEAEDVTFEIAVDNVSATSAEIRYEPWDPSHRFAYEVVEKAAYDAAADKRQFIQDAFNEILDAYMEMNPVFSRDQAVQILSSEWHSVDYKRDYLEPDTEYYAWAAVINENGHLQGEPAVEYFKTTAYEASDVSIVPSIEEYYSGSYLAELYPEEFENLASKAIFTFDIELSENVAEYSIALLPGDYTDRAQYGDFYLIGDISAFGVKNPSEADVFTCWTETDVTLCAYAMDEQGRYGKVYRKLIRFKESEAIRTEPPFLAPGIRPASLVK